MSDNGNGVNGEPGREERLDSKVIPVMREAVTTVQLVLFRRLKERLSEKYTHWPAENFGRFVGCVVNDLFGTPPQETEAAAFAREHIEDVERELWALAENVPDLLPILTDALRMQTICDHEEGVHTLPTLLRARALGVLQEERAVPLPSTFMLAVRKLGAENGLIQPMAPGNPDEA
ncbi:MAG: hypothetical protein Kow0089_21090 [Desulfobulbaceae bacterium]